MKLLKIHPHYSPSLEDRMMLTKFRSSGFDYMRLGLAACVVLYHCIVCSYGPASKDALAVSNWHPFIALVLPMFFSLSGFLVAGSLDRSKTLLSFFGLRAIRILPALTVEVFLSACILGPLITSDSLSSYFSSDIFHAYFFNIIGYIHFELPGVFINNPDPDLVNGQLWTIPSELDCYALIGAACLLGAFRRRWILLCMVIAMYTQQLINAVQLGPASPVNIGTVTPHELVRIFVGAVLIYQYRDKIPFNFYLFLAAAVCSILLLSDKTAERFVFLPVAYMTIYLGLLNPKRTFLINNGDFSYGVYLYSSAIQQSIASLGPTLQHWYWSLLIGVPISSIIAACSWFFIERPTLRLRPALERFEAFALSKLSRVDFLKKLVLT